MPSSIALSTTLPRPLEIGDAAAEIVAAEADEGDFQAGAAEGAVFHGILGRSRRAE